MLVESRGAGTRGRGECRGSPSATLRTTNGQLLLLDFLSTMALASRPDKTVPAWLIVTWAWAGGLTMNQRGIRKAIIRSSWAPVVLALGGLFGASRSGAEDIDNLTPQADLSILKDDVKTSVALGTNDTYTVAVTNNGPSTITGATVSDVLPAGTAFVSATGGATYNPGTNTVNYTTGTLATGGTATFSLTLFISPMLSGTLTNTATVAPPSGATDPV